MKKRLIRVLFFMLLLTFSTAFAASAKAQGWVRGEDGSYTYFSKTGRVLESTYYPEKGFGIVKSGKNTYCIRLDGKKYRGLLELEGAWYYFKPSNGKMVTKKRVRINKVYYYFGADGKRVEYTWVGRRYYGENGEQVFSALVDGRYVNEKGLYVKGKKIIDGKLYYFDPSTGAMFTGGVLKLDGKTYYFDASGVGRAATEDGTTVETTYFTDPEVDDETLLAAIIYSEAGNQPYYGQVAVGLVIMNRVRSKLFPSKLKDVIYAKDQFEPARNNWLTRALSGQIYVTESCKRAAKEAMTRAAALRMAGS